MFVLYERGLHEVARHVVPQDPSLGGGKCIVVLFHVQATCTGLLTRSLHVPVPDVKIRVQSRESYWRKSRTSHSPSAMGPVRANHSQISSSLNPHGLTYSVAILSSTVVPPGCDIVAATCVGLSKFWSVSTAPAASVAQRPKCSTIDYARYTGMFLRGVQRNEDPGCCIPWSPSSEFPGSGGAYGHCGLVVVESFSVMHRICRQGWFTSTLLALVLSAVKMCVTGALPESCQSPGRAIPGHLQCCRVLRTLPGHVPWWAQLMK